MTRAKQAAPFVERLWRQSEKGSLWKWLFALSFPIAIYFFLTPSLQWGSNSDDAWYFYGDGGIAWPQVLHSVFLPNADKVFIFGEDRPVQTLFFKAAHDLHFTPDAFHIASWVIAWLSCLGFAWGLITLIRAAYPIARSSVWMLATLLWWVPATQFSAAVGLLSPWVLGFCGLFWAFFYREKATPRQMALGVFFGFLACQTVEDAWPILSWSAIWLLVATWLKGTKRTEVKRALVPLAIVAFHVFLFRSLDPVQGNRSEIVVSLSARSVLDAVIDYAMIGLNAVWGPLLTWLGRSMTWTGIAGSESPASALLCLAALGVLAYDGLRQRKPQEKTKTRAAAHHPANMNWLLLLGGVMGILPYLAITNRHFFYYGLKLNAFIAAFIVCRVYLSGKATPAVLAVVLYLSSSLVAASSAMLGWNFTKFYAGDTRTLFKTAMALPGADQCSGAHPCCLKMSGKRTWNNHEYIVDWYLGAPVPPAFVPLTMPCERTLEMPRGM